MATDTKHMEHTTRVVTLEGPREHIEQAIAELRSNVAYDNLPVNVSDFDDANYCVADAEVLTFIFEALVRINDRQERHSPDTADDLNEIQRAVETLRQCGVAVDRRTTALDSRQRHILDHLLHERPKSLRLGK